MDKRRIMIICGVVIAALIVLATINTARGSVSKSLKNNSFYSFVEGYSDFSFAVPARLAKSASAISRITEDMEVDKNNVYLYRDEDDYLLFSVNSILIAARRGTNFDIFNAEDKESAIEKDHIANIWITKDASRKLNYTESKNLFIADVNAGLVITNDIYNDFVGQVAILNENGTEYALFVGAPIQGESRFVKLEKSTQKYIKEMVNSITTDAPAPMVIEEVYAVSISSDTISAASPLDGTVSEDTVVLDIPDTVTVSDNYTVSDNDAEATETGAVSDEDAVVITESPAIEEPAEEIEEPEDEPIEEPEKDKSSSSSEPPAEVEVEKDSSSSSSVEEVSEPSEEPIDTGDDKKKLKLNNQKTIEKEDNKAYTSNIYAMLKLKDNGIIKEYDSSTNQVVTPIIKIDRVYKGETALNLIREYYKKDKTLNYFGPPVGCEWHVAEYKLSYAGCASKPYINIKLKGVDGNHLNYMGVSYPKRTYDINGDDGICRCYYAVPIGCHEYVLECGTGSIELPGSENSAAYYHILY